MAVLRDTEQLKTAGSVADHGYLHFLGFIKFRFSIKFCSSTRYAFDSNLRAVNTAASFLLQSYEAETREMLR